MDTSRYDFRASTRIAIREKEHDARCRQLEAELERVRFERDALARAYARYVHQHLGLRYTEAA